jgi:glycosyltransferase involved in cell wall biosynthesis
MRIGIIGIRFTKGMGCLAEDIARLMESLGHQVYFLSYPLSHRKPCLTTGDWKRDNVTIVNRFHRTTVKLSDEDVAVWVAANKLNLVLTLEEPNNPSTFSICKSLKVPTINYIDIEMFNPDLKDVYKECSLFFCPTQHCYDIMFQYGYQNLMLVKYMANIYKYPWTLRKARGSERVQFIMHGGWGGQNSRKGVEPVVRAFTQANHSNTHLTVLTQKKWKTYDEETKKIASKCDRIKIQEINNTDVVYNSGAYAFGHLSVACSKWEGLGLPHLESLISGMPVLTCDARPMSEHVEHEKTGWLVEAEMVPGNTIKGGLRIDVALVNEEKLAGTFSFFGDNPNYVENMSLATEQVRSKYADYRQAFDDMLKRFV